LEGSVYLFSPYTTKTQTTTVTVGGALESYSKSPKPVSENEKTITYGPYEGREPFTQVGFVLTFVLPITCPMLKILFRLKSRNSDF